MGKTEDERGLGLPDDGFPVGKTLAGGRWRITEELYGEPDRGIYRALGTGGDRALVTLAPPQRVPLEEVRRALSASGDGVAELLAVTPLETRGTGGGRDESAYDALVEAEPEGEPIARAVPVPLDPRAAISLARTVAGWLAAHHARGAAFGGLRPELLYVRPGPRGPVATGMAPRAERFWSTATFRCYGVPPCFSRLYLAFEIVAGRPPVAASDVFSLGAMLASWLSGEHPFDGDDATAQAMAIAGGARRPFTGPQALAALVDRTLQQAAERRPTAAELRDALAAEGLA